MCTQIDDKATKVMNKNLKNTGNIAWKVVKVVENDYYAPMREGLKYKRKKRNTEIQPVKSNAYYPKAIGAGVFHLFRSRKIGREMLKAMKELPYYYGDKLKLIKVFYGKKDFHGIGTGTGFTYSLRIVLDRHELNTVCVKGFKFVED